MKNCFVFVFGLFVNTLLFSQKNCAPGDDKPPCPQVGCNRIQCDCKDEGDGIKMPVFIPYDPNEIIGPAGYDTTVKWVSVSATLPYKILFENDPDLATGPVQKVTVYCPIDNKLNPSSFRLGDFGFGSFNFSVPENSSIYSTRLDVRDSLGVFVNVTAGLDITNRRAFWVFESIDPATGLAATLPAGSGFLPVNDTVKRNGEGYVSFTIKPISTAKTRDTAAASASIIFDSNELIVTNTWKNTIDAVAPVSKVNLPNTVDSTFTVNWTAKDDSLGAGLKNYELYYSKNGGPFVLHQNNIDTTAISFTGEKGATYAFYTLATDQTGNKEIKTKADDTTTVLTDSIYISTNGATTFCLGDSVILTSSSFNGNIWSTGATTRSIVVKSGGTYNVTVNINGLIKTSANIVVTVNPLPPTPIITAGGPTTFCQGDSVTLTSTPAYSYLWSNGSTKQRIVVKSSNKIAVITTNSNGCISTKSDTVKVVVKSLSYSDTSVVICNKFTWHGSTYVQSGNYTYIGTNAVGCDSVETLHLTILSVTSTYTKTDAGCFGSATGSITITPTSGAGPYTYRLGTAGSFVTSNTFSNLKAGSYRVSIIDASGCAGISDQVIITQQPAITATFTKTDAGCFGSATGSITVTPTSGIAPYTYRLGSSGGFGSSSTFNNLRAGTYRVSILDAKNCPGTITNIVIAEQPAITSTFTKTDAGCFGSNNGSITVTPNSGVLPYTYRLGTLGSFGPSNSFNNLAAGTYKIYIQDANGCTGTTDPIVIGALPPIAVNISITHVSCKGMANGSFTATPTNGTPPFTYRLGNTGSFGSSNIFTGLRASTYSLFVKDANGCSNALNVTVNQPEALNDSIITTNVACFGGTTGIIKANATGGTAPYLYRLGSVGGFSTTNIFTGLRTGSYRVYVQDARGCSFNSSAIIVQPTNLSLTFTKTDLTCINKNDGAITLSGVGGTPPYKFRLGTVGAFGAANSFINLKPGSYRAYMQDSNNCQGNSVAISILPSTVNCVTIIAKTTKPPINDSSLQVFLVPNPTTSQFTLTVKAADEPLSVRVLDINGRAVYATKGFPGQSFMFGKSFMKGIYLVEVRQGNQVKTVKAIKE